MLVGQPPSTFWGLPLGRKGGRFFKVYHYDSPHMLTPSPPPQPQLPPFNMANVMKMPVFKGIGSEDP